MSVLDSLLGKGIQSEPVEADQSFVRTGMRNTEDSITQLISSFSSASRSVTPDEISNAFQAFITCLDHTPAYIEGEVKIHLDQASELTVMNLLLCGTMPLDAILYMSLHQASPGIFTLLPPLYKDKASMAKASTIARGAFISFIVTLVCRGKIPGGSSTNSPALIKLLKDQALAGSNIDSEFGLASICSTAPLNKFPSSVIFSIDFANFPLSYSGRMSLGPAGTRAIKYAILSKRFERNPAVPEIIAMVDAMCTINFGNAWKHVHPLRYASNKFAFPKATLKLTRLVLSSLTYKGQMDFAKHIEGSKNESFKKDKSFNIGTKGDHQVLTIMEDPEADISSLTISRIMNFFGEGESQTV